MTGSPIGDALQRELRDAGHDAADAMRRLTHPHLFRHDQHDAPATTAVPDNETQEVTPMTVAIINDIKSGLASVEEKLEHLDADALDKVAAIKANPEAAALLDTLGTIAKAELPAGFIQVAGGALAELEKFATAKATPAAPPADELPPAPAGPVIAGQA